MKKVILTLAFCFSFLFSFGNDTKAKKINTEVFNCWVTITYLTVNPETFETTSFTWQHWVGYAGSQESCNAQAQEFADSL